MVWLALTLAPMLLFLLLGMGRLEERLFRDDEARPSTATRNRDTSYGERRAMVRDSQGNVFQIAQRT